MELLEKLKQLNLEYVIKLSSMGGSIVGFSLEPFLSSYFDHSQGGAYPHVASTTPLFPLLVQFGWLLPLNDEYFVNYIRSVAAIILQTVLNEKESRCRWY
jgi:hypothetical protein